MITVYIVLEEYRRGDDSNIAGVFAEEADAIKRIDEYEVELHKMGDGFWCNEEMQVTILPRELL